MAHGEDMPERVLPAAVDRVGALLAGAPPEVLRVADHALHGLARHDLRDPRLHTPTRGVRTPVEPAALRDRAQAFAAGLPDDVAFSHVTAALLHGLHLPRRVEEDSRLHVIRHSGRTRIRRAGCAGHRGLECRIVGSICGLRVVSPADTWVDLAELVRPGLTLDDLVVAGDVVANRRGGVDDLRAALARRVRPRGAAMLDDALAEIRPGTRSPMETRARLMFVRAGLPEPEINAAVHDVDGEWILEADLLWRQQKVIAEYQGAVHAPIEQRSVDNQRRQLAEDNGHVVIEVFKEDVFGGVRRATCIRRVRTALGL